VHCFGDGILIASAFLADMRLGVIAAVSVLAHEVPHHMGDLVVMRLNSNRNAAVLKVSLAGAVTAFGGLVGYFLVGQLEAWLPFFLTIASSSFVYVALSDLIPQLQNSCPPGKRWPRWSGWRWASCWSRWSATWPTADTEHPAGKQVHLHGHAIKTLATLRCQRWLMQMRQRARIRPFPAAPGCAAGS
jgi:hypothetical protein